MVGKKTKTKVTTETGEVEIDHMLVQVAYTTWMPWDMRQASQGQFDAKAKIDVAVKLWAPLPVDANGRVDRSLLPPDEQGALWAQREIMRMRPDGHEILCILSAEPVILNGTIMRASNILNQPEIGKPEKSEPDGEPEPKKPSLIIT